MAALHPRFAVILATPADPGKPALAPIAFFFDERPEYARISAAVEIRLDIPDPLFDDDFTAAAFEARVREFAVLELLRAKRLHEHEAARMLALERWELVERMEHAGIVPTEKEFDQIKGELGAAVASIKSRFGNPGNPGRKP